jgi:hypothetical protein
MRSVRKTRKVYERPTLDAVPLFRDITAVRAQSV